MLNNYFQELIYNCVYIYSKIQLYYFSNVHPFLVSLTECIHFILTGENYDTDNNSIEFYDEGKLILSEKVLQYPNILDSFSCYNLIIYSHYNIDLIYDKKLFYKSTNSNIKKENEKVDIGIDISNVKFVDITLIYNNNTYPIKLSTNKYNFYIVDNVINMIFIKYYIINMLYLSIDNTKNFTYKLIIMDNNINVLNLDENDSILLLKNDDKIMKTLIY